MEQLFVVLVGVLILLASTITSVVRKFIQKSRARKARSDVQASSAGRSSLASIPVTDIADKERALRDQMRIDGVTQGEVERYGDGEPTGLEARLASATKSSGSTMAPVSIPEGSVTMPKRSSGISRIQSLPPLKRAIIWSEVLSKPLAERDPARHSNDFHD